MPTCCTVDDPLPDSTEVSHQLLEKLLPGREDAKLSAWLKVLLDEEFRTVGDLRALTPDAWNSIALPLAVKARLQSACTATKDTAPSALPSVAPSDPLAPSLAAVVRPAQQVDMIVLDVSGSMKSRSAMDELKTREDVSKIVFHVMVEHILALEMDHVLGLIAFGEAVTAFDITRDYEKFHLELGRLDANQNRTKLFDAILAAGQCLETFVAGAKEPVARGAPLRIFALTDGEDNASSNTAWAVTQWLQDHHIVLDVFPMASRLPVLQAMATATGGICVDVANEEQGMKLFESEPLLHCASRDPPAKKPLRVSCEADLNSLSGSSAAPMREVVSQKCHTVAPTHALTNEQAQHAASSGGSSVKRIVNEYSKLEGGGANGPWAFVSDDVHQWTCVIKGPPNSPYEGGFWAISVLFPQDYPFHPPRVRFVTPVYHCNIDSHGNICLDILKDNWSPALTIGKVLLSLTSLLSDPNPNDPLDVFKAQLYRTDRSRYDSECRAMVSTRTPHTIEEVRAEYHLQ